MKASKADKQGTLLPLLTGQQINVALARADAAFKACSAKMDEKQTQTTRENES